MKKIFSDVSNENYGIKHIAFIMDGNGRWAKERNRPRTYGHQEGFKRLFEIAEICSYKKIDVMTIYAFSTENWNRPKREVSFLFNTLEKRFNVELKKMMKLNMSLRVMGVLDKLPESTQKVIREGIEQTKHNTGLVLNICLNYGGRDEITRAIRHISADVKNEKLMVNEIDQTLVGNYLDSSGLPEVDLMIRTSGEMRLSNFMLWQLSYAEFSFPKTYWPDFNGAELEKCIIEFAHRTRRFGGLVNVEQTK
jgi:undecaprenyl diphosphate synthase